MVIKGGIRGNGGQLARYLTKQGENDHIRILDVDGREDSDRTSLIQTLESMSLMEQLTKSRQGLYHAQINPAYEEDRTMTDADWHKAADILGEALGLDGQRRAIVLHEKKGRIHAHVVWERYDHDNQRMIPIAHNYRKHDKARVETERVFGQEKTPQKNKHRPELKERMTELWNKTETGEEFVREAEKAGYMIAAGSGKRPFMVVNSEGRSFNLVRQIDGVKTKDVKARLGKTKLPSDKVAIERMHQRQREAPSKAAEKSPPKRQRTPEDRTPSDPHQARMEIARHFASNRDETLKAGEKKKEATEPKPTLERARSFADNRDSAMSREERRQAIFAEMKAELEQNRQRNRDRGRGY